MIIFFEIKDGDSSQYIKSVVTGSLYGFDTGDTFFLNNGQGSFDVKENYQYTFSSQGYNALTLDGSQIIEDINNGYGSVLIQLYKTTYDITTGAGDGSQNLDNNKKLFGVSALFLLAALLFLLQYKKDKKKMGKIETSDVFPFLLIGGGIIAFSVVKKLLQGVGIWESGDTKALDQAEENPYSFWNPNFYKQYSTYTYAINLTQATEYANRIYDAFGIFNDCEECVKSVFGEMKTQSNVSYLSAVFNEIYQQDLLKFLRGGWWPQDRLSDADVSEINTMISKLPTH